MSLPVDHRDVDSLLALRWVLYGQPFLIPHSGVAFSKTVGMLCDGTLHPHYIGSAHRVEMASVERIVLVVEDISRWTTSLPFGA